MPSSESADEATDGERTAIAERRSIVRMMQSRDPRLDVAARATSPSLNRTGQYLFMADSLSKTALRTP